MAANGDIPDELLVPAAGTAGARLRPGAASAWAAMRAEVARRFGWTPTIVSAGDAYRSLARQVDLFHRNYTTTNTGYGPRKLWNGVYWWRRTSGTPSAATPGTSNHGLGTTVDITGVGWLNQFSHPWYSDLTKVAPAFGFSNAEGRSIGEPWHWSYTGNADLASNPVGGVGSVPTVPNLPGLDPLEDDMPLTDADVEKIWGYLYTHTDGAGPAPMKVFVGDARSFGVRVQDALALVPSAVWNVPIEHEGAGPAPAYVFMANARSYGVAIKDAIGNLGAAAVDVPALAAALAPLLSTATGTGLTVEQVQAATEQAVREVLTKGTDG